VLVTVRQGSKKRVSAGRAIQRQRTRQAIVDATMRLLARSKETPSVDEIAYEALVSRRTVYMYFPRVEQLLLDATLGALGEPIVDPALDAASPDDALARVDVLVRTIAALSDETMDLGRRLIRLTLDADAPALAHRPRRGYRRIGWIEAAVSPLRPRLSREQHHRLVSGLTLLLGWEAFIQLRDLRGLGRKAETRVIAWAAHALVQATIAEAQRDSRVKTR
jgi:AcrR family transcriptional regulator